jgi:serine/threonine protein kinase
MRSKRMNRLPKEFSYPVLIGAGEYSTVYRAYQSRVDRMVALKVFKLHKKEVINKIFSETNMLGSVSLSCVPRVYDVQYSSCGPVIVMEWIRGVSLDYFLSVNTDRALNFAVVQKILESLSELHKKNIAHGDLKPDNIILSPQGCAYIVDFGFASETVRHAFTSDTIRGTPEYMAPELWSYEKNVDLKRSDIYAAGVLIGKILGNEFPVSLQSSTDSNPVNRPPDASTMLSLWKEEQHVEINDRLWTIAVTSATSSFMIGKYVEAVGWFLKKKRHTDAYQIVTDILEESPENAYALSMLQSMALSKKKSGLKLLLSSMFAAIAAVALYFVAFELGRSADNEHSIYDSVNSLGTQSNTLLHLGYKEKKVIGSSPVSFRYTKDAAKIDGVVRCILPSLEGNLIVDGQKMKMSGNKQSEISCTLSQGIHTFEWNDVSTGVISVETIQLLPFENKKIKIGPMPEKNELPRRKL